MADVVARCPDCDREPPGPFTRCDWCGRRAPSRWCLACSDWHAVRACAACAGGLRVPSELNLGEHVGGATVTFRFAVWIVGEEARRLRGEGRRRADGSRPATGRPCGRHGGRG